MKRALISSLLLLASSNGHADSIEVHTACKHYGSERHYQEVNPGLGYIKDFKHLYGSAGAYYGSEKSPIGYLLIGKDFGTKNIRVGLETGLVFGYSVAPVLPAAAPTLEIKYKGFGIKSRILPLFEKNNGLVGEVLTLSLIFEG